MQSTNLTSKITDKLLRRNLEFFADHIGVKPQKNIAAKYRVSEDRIRHIFWKYARMTWQRAQVIAPGEIEALFPEDRYPQYWHFCTFQPQLITLPHWRKHGKKLYAITEKVVRKCNPDFDFRGHATNSFRPTNYGFDWDGCVTTAPHAFLEFAKALIALGHNVYVVTMRYPSESGDIEQWRGIATDIIFTNRLAKDRTCRAMGIIIDVWLEDNPAAIMKDGVEIWGSVTPEGVTISDPKTDADTIATFFTVGIAYRSVLIGTLGKKNVRHVRCLQHIKRSIFHKEISCRDIEAIIRVTGEPPLLPVEHGTKVQYIPFKSIAALDTLLRTNPPKEY